MMSHAAWESNAPSNCSAAETAATAATAASWGQLLPQCYRQLQMAYATYHY